MPDIKDLVADIFKENAQKREEEQKKQVENKPEPESKKKKRWLPIPQAKPGTIPDERKVEDWMTEREKEEIIAHNVARERLIYEESLPAKERALKCILFEDAVRKGELRV